MKSFDQQPADVLDYGIDLTKWLVAGDTVLTATASAVPNGLTLSVTDEDTTIPRVWVGSGTPNNEYQVTLKVTTVVGRIKEFEFKIYVIEK